MHEPPNHDDYWRRLARDPEFAAKMSERQRELGKLHERHERDTERQAANQPTGRWSAVSVACEAF